jgi:hypothetical protein
MVDDKAPVEKAVDLLVYAPVGLALYVRDMLPSMMGIFVARGRRELGGKKPPPPPPTPDLRRRVDESVGVARAVAEGGIGVARGMAGTGFGLARGVAGTAVSSFLQARDASAPSAATTGTAPSRSGSAPAAATAAPVAGDAPPVDSLAIADYDELSASQVVERLEGLDSASLEAIRRYESAHRGRNTILGKIARLS